MNDITEVRAGAVGTETDQQAKAFFLHQCCLASAASIKQNISELCINLSIIKDERLYLLLGSNKFDDYCATSLNIAHVQANKYYIVGSFLRSFETVHPGEQKVTDCNSFNDLGIEKMYLLASLKPGEFKSIEKDTDLVKVSKSDLKTKIKDLRALQQVKESQKFSGSISDFKESVKLVSDEYNKVVSGSSNSVHPKLLQYYQMLLELRSLLSLISEIQSSIENDNSVAFPAGMYFHPEFDLNRINIELHDIEINYNI